MSKNIVLLSDGTGNSSAKLQKTNVWRLFQALDQTSAKQIAKYDDGVGTSRNKFLAIIGGAFGWGLKRNVLDLYKFVCRNHKSNDDHIYGFGFSRGSFTIRVLVDLIDTEGLVPFRSEEELSHNAAAAYRHYRSAKFPSRSPFVFLMRGLRDAAHWCMECIKGRSYGEIAEQSKREILIRFLGLWDTVDAYGMPIAGLKRGIDLVLWPMLFNDTILSPLVEQACHALSLDDERTPFEPILWDEIDEAKKVEKGNVKSGRIKQVWFAGVHSNVGGGYPEDQLSLVSLEWMMGEAMANGLALDKEAVAKVRAAASLYARLYDSRAGIASYYGYFPRQIEKCVKNDPEREPILPIIHGSVVIRMACGSDRYTPISLPHEFWVLAPDGELLAMEGEARSLKIDQTKKQMTSAGPATKSDATISAAKDRLVEAIGQLSRPDKETVDLVWDTVFWRRCLYFVTLVSTLFLVAYPWVVEPIINHFKCAAEIIDKLEKSTGIRSFITSIVDSLSGLLPSYAKPWITAFTHHPFGFALIAVFIVVTLHMSSVLDVRIHDRAWLGWHKTSQEPFLKWSQKAQKDRGRLIGLAFLIAALFLVLASVCRLNDSVQGGLWFCVLSLGIYLVFRTIVQLPFLRSKEPELDKRFFLDSVARFLRCNKFLQRIYRLVFDGAFPIIFALLLLVAGLCVANHALFDVVSASGHFCKGSVTCNAGDPRTGIIDEEKLGSRDGFQTDKMYWASGLCLKDGRRYRITLEMERDWFDRTLRANVAGFPSKNLWQMAAVPLRRWWRENWFTPIARIGEIGNDEYVLSPADEFDSATPQGRRAVTVEINARTSGELFLYVNDAVLMVPGASDLFYRNNTGTGKVTVELMTGVSSAPQ